MKAKLLLFLFLFTSILFSQTTFLKYFDEGYSEGKQIINTKDDNYLIIGNIKDTVTYCAYVIKIDQLGNLIWSKTYGDSNHVQIQSVCESSNGSLYFSGYNNWKLWILNTNSSGDSLWSRTYDFRTGTSILEANDSGLLILTSNELEELCLLKIDESGNIIWTRNYSFTYEAYGYNIISVNDTGYAITATLGIHGDSGIMFMKINNVGDTLVYNRYSYNQYSENGGSVVETDDEGYFICGYCADRNPDFNYNAWLIKTDSMGDTSWTVCYKNKSSYAFSGIQLENGKYIAAGGISGGEYPGNIFLIKLFNDGTIEWTREIGNVDSTSFRTNSIIETVDGGYLLTGYSLFHTGYDCGKNIQRLIVVKTDSMGQVLTSNISNYIIPEFTLSQNRPNPLNPTTTIEFAIPEPQHIKLQVFDITGRLVETLVDEFKGAGNWDVKWNAGSYSSGIYIYRLVYGDRQISRKMVVLK
ncbi:MAG: T9SS type A sorting domain-containing protein [Candidatus Marinimicrobia bacterium]|nr:T9SS type A sorting domain-containing protein [Candidatus Neomarinimicrobiota bacterium]